MSGFTTDCPIPNPCKCGNTMPGIAHISFLSEMMYYVKCPLCGEEGTFKLSAALAVESWNRRLKRRKEK